jgi:plastocyanin
VARSIPHLLVAALACLAVAAPAATAAEVPVQVGDDFFDPFAVQIEPGDTVVWNWVGLEGDHSVTTEDGQIETFDSDPGNNEPVHAPGSEPFRYTFDREGRVTYLCKTHPFTMSGSVTVGTPDLAKPRFNGTKAKLTRLKVRVSFTLSERSTVVLRVARASKPGKVLRRVKRTLGAGKRTIAFKRKGLAEGSYRVRLSAEDAAGNKAKLAKTSFKLG